VPLQSKLISSVNLSLEADFN